VAWVPYMAYSMYVFNISLSNPANDLSNLGDTSFTFRFTNHSYTLFELWFRFVFLVISFIFVIVFAHKMKTFPWRDWTLEQRWAIVLLLGLMAYNNPFFPLEILTNNWFPIFFNRVLYLSFIVILLLFWLVTFDGIRKETVDRSFGKFYLPKIVLVGGFWLCAVVVYTWIQQVQLKDPNNDPYSLPGLIFFEVVMLIILIVYVFWLVIVVCRSCGDARTLPFLGERLKILGGFTLAVIIVVVAGLIFGAVSNFNNAAEFTSYVSLFNLYVYVLAFFYMPSQAAAKEAAKHRADRLGMVRLEDEEDGSTPGGFSGLAARGGTVSAPPASGHPSNPLAANMVPLDSEVELSDVRV